MTESTSNHHLRRAFPFRVQTSTMSFWTKKEHRTVFSDAEDLAYQPPPAHDIVRRVVH